MSVARQTSLSMEFPTQEYWSGFPFPSPGELPNPGIEFASPALQVDFLLTETPEKPHFNKFQLQIKQTYDTNFGNFHKVSNIKLIKISQHLLLIKSSQTVNRRRLYQLIKYIYKSPPTIIHEVERLNLGGRKFVCSSCIVFNTVLKVLSVQKGNKRT